MSAQDICVSTPKKERAPKKGWPRREDVITRNGHLARYLSKVYRMKTSGAGYIVLSYRTSVCLARDVARSIYRNLVVDSKIRRSTIRDIYWNTTFAPINVSQADIEEVIVYELVDGGGYEEEFEKFFNAIKTDLNIYDDKIEFVYDLEEDRAHVTET